ncbi:MAG TPA: hypothetical protein VLA97_07245, partial [Nocardioidaceae bacterium]|nr:hypothetical protein [Nocardioidaceae bacterium]
MARVGRVLVAALGAVLVVPALSVATVDDYRPGASGAGDRYFPRDGNGGYDVRRYGLDLRYRPATDRLTGTATIRAVATQPLSLFHLDLDAMTVRSVRVDGRRARWEHRRGELVVDPAGPGLRRGKRFVVTVRYGGVPRAIHDVYGTSGFFHTSDGLLIAGQPKVASTWFPVNDHPTDTAPFTFAITAPARLQVVANGVLRRTVQQGRQRTWHWVANDPMAPYLATVAVGRFDLRSYRRDGIRYWDAIDPATRKAVARPRSGTRFAIGGQANQGYKRLTRVVDVPAEGATVSFRTRYDVEDGWDFWFVEARPVGGDRWTTLRDRNGHTDRWPGFNCLGLLELHPFLRHYLARTETGGCRARGTTGQWHAATGRSRGYEPWSVSLDRYAGQTVELSLTHVTDGIFPVHGVFVDDVSVSTGEGSTSFEADDDPWDGWTVPGPPASSPGNTDDWKAGTATDAPPSFGEVGSRSLRKQPAMISFLSRRFGPYPFEAAGGIVDHEPRLLFALENQTRPVYPRTFLYYQLDSDLTVVH